MSFAVSAFARAQQSTAAMNTTAAIHFLCLPSQVFLNADYLFMSPLNTFFTLPGSFCSFW